jgi:ankyrin repeat protein
MFIAANGSIELAEILLQHGADINTTDSQKETPLHWAYLEEMIDMIKYLVEHGANAELQNEDGLQPHQMNGSSNIIITKPTGNFT